jgi:hypothetical protein
MTVRPSTFKGRPIRSIFELDLRWIISYRVAKIWVENFKSVESYRADRRTDRQTRHSHKGVPPLNK